MRGRFSICFCGSLVGYLIYINAAVCFLCQDWIKVKNNWELRYVRFRGNY